LPSAEGDGSRRIKGIVEGLLEDWKKKKIFKKDIIERAWKKAAGKKALKHTRVSSFRSGRLIIEVDESGWIYELTIKKKEILDSLNKKLAAEDIAISEIQFRIGTL